MAENKVSVLIVDDSAPFRRAARELLRRRGYVVVGEAGCATAATTAGTRPFALPVLRKGGAVPSTKGILGG